MDKKKRNTKNGCSTWLGRKWAGQGVVEYAGAMVVSTLIVATVLTIGQSRMGDIYNTMFDDIQTFFTLETGRL